MSILHGIQTSIARDQSNMAPVLLKLRLLATKLGSKELESWIQFESEGYPDTVKLPDYRKIPVVYSASFAGAFGSQINNATIPPSLIETIAGSQWRKCNFRESISAIENIISRSESNVRIDASDLSLSLQGKIYPDYTCVSVVGNFSVSKLIEIQNLIRHRILEFSVQLEKSIPLASTIDFAKSEKNDFSKNHKEVTQMFNQIIQGGGILVNSAGDNATINVSVIKGDKSSLINYFVSKNLPKDDAMDLANIIESEKPTNQETPFGEKIKKWIKENLIKKSETWKMTYSALLIILEKAVSVYYGL